MSSRTRIEKSFDCLAYKERVQAEVFEHIKSMSFDEERSYFRRRAEQGPLGRWWKRVRASGQAEAREE